MLVQWIQSEKKRLSFVSPIFWKLSLSGNLLLYLHHVVQVQFHFAILQSINALIAWRNLDFLKVGRPHPRSFVFFLLGVLLCLTTVLFLFQGYFLLGEMDWIRTPQKVWNSDRQYHSLIWHCVGTLGAILFASRFWVQWWVAEFYQKSVLGKAYWYLSIIGSLIVLAYAVHIKDVVVIFYHLFSLIPYLRNLVLLKN